MEKLIKIYDDMFIEFGFTCAYQFFRGFLNRFSLNKGFQDAASHVLSNLLVEGEPWAAGQVDEFH